MLVVNAYLEELWSLEGADDCIFSVRYKTTRTDTDTAAITSRVDTPLYRIQKMNPTVSKNTK